MSRLSMRKISEILRQRHALNQSYREIANSLNMSISTVSDYIRRAKLASLTWPLPDAITEENLYSMLFVSDTTEAEKSVKPDWKAIYKEYAKKGMTLRLLWKEYRDQHPEGLGYSRFCWHYQEYKKTLNPVMRQSHKAGEKAFVDYAGMTMEWIDAKSGQIHEAQIFVGCLGASQYIFTEATATQRLPEWIASHIRMFEYFDGVPEMLVPDNLKSGVTKAHRYDPDINPNYQHLCEHYGTAIVPARAMTPKDKAKVENAVGIIERQLMAALRHQTFTSLTEMNGALKEGLKKLNAQLFQKMETSRDELFQTIDKPALKPLPATRYQYATWQKAKVPPDYHIHFEKHFYSVPYQYIRQTVEIRATSKTVEFFLKQQRIASHLRSYESYGYTTLTEHKPKAHRVQAEYSLDFIMTNAKKIGENTHAFVKNMLASRAFPQQAYRACYGLIQLESRFTGIRLEKACAKGLLIGATRYQQIETMLKNHCEEVPLLENHPPQNLIHHNIRGAHYYH